MTVKMSTKILMAKCRTAVQALGLLRTKGQQKSAPPPPQLSLVIRRYSEFLPPTQYDNVFPNKFKPSYALRKYIELIPLFGCTGVAIFGVIFNFIWCCFHKVDVVFTTHSANNISRTMNLRHPTIHKMITINQIYEPWPEMQDVLDKMLVAEHRSMIEANMASGNQ